MSLFTKSPPWYVNQGNKYLTVEPLVWEIGRLGSGMFITVPVAFFFDFTSHWSYSWLFNPDNPQYLKAACLHDYALHELQWDRVTSAGLFAEALKADGVNKFKRLVMVVSVVVFKFR